MVPGGAELDVPLIDIGDVSGNSRAWIVNLPVGAAVNIKLVDSTGSVAYSSTVEVQKGSSDGCLGVSCNTTFPANFED